MAKTDVVFFAEEDGASPLFQWMDNVPSKAQDKIIIRIERLKEMGHELRRPEADYLRDKIYELRVTLQGIQYRVLYFFSSKIAVVSHGCTKRGRVSARDIDLAVQRKARFEKNPLTHTYEE